MTYGPVFTSPPSFHTVIRHMRPRSFPSSADSSRASLTNCHSRNRHQARHTGVSLRNPQHTHIAILRRRSEKICNESPRRLKLTVVPARESFRWGSTLHVPISKLCSCFNGNHEGWGGSELLPDDREGRGALWHFRPVERADQFAGSGSGCACCADCVGKAGVLRNQLPDSGQVP